ncbi:MAG: hypothetical protein PVG92_04075 [Holophagae bacterium]|jgi:hypothetical protein
MRKTTVAVTMCVIAATTCLVDAGVARRQYCEDDYRRLWMAVRYAVSDIGARIIHSDERGGTVVGRIEADIYGHTVEISVYVDRDRDRASRPGTAESMWVRVKAKIPKVKKPDEEQQEQLREIEDQVFNLISARSACGPPQ